jgi:hypothetical protein
MVLLVEMGDPFWVYFKKLNGCFLLLPRSVTIGQEASPVSFLTDEAPGPMMAVAKANG